MKFEYYVTDSKKGSRVKGSASAENLSELVENLRKKGYKDIKVFPVRERTSSHVPRKRVAAFGRVDMKDLKIFTRQVASTLSAGLLLTDALETVGEDMEDTYLGKVIRLILDDVRAGTDFSTALTKFPHVFPDSYTAIVRSGEATGWLHQTLADLAKYLEDSDRLREKIKASISYPLFVLGFSVLISIVLLVFIIPRFKELYDQAGASLPFLTQIVIQGSDFLLKNLIAIIVLFFAFLIALGFSCRIPAVQHRWDALVIRIPLIGKEIIHKGLVARFCRTFGFLLEGGVPITQTLGIVRQVVGNYPMQKSIDRLGEHVEAGGMLSDKMRSLPIFPRLVAKMVSVGEKSGKIAEMFNRTSVYYEEEIEFSIRKLTAMIEPTLIIFVGGIIAFVVVALYLPIFRLSTLIR